MSNKRSANSATPDGPEIKRLRVAQGDLQEKFASEAGLSLRNLQRAEKGIAIGAQYLDRIAEHLEVPVEQIRKTENKDYDHLRPIKGRLFIEWVQRSPPKKVEYTFLIDPDLETSELVANIIKYCDTKVTRSNSPQKRLTPDQAVRAMGALNEKLKLLAKRGVGVFGAKTFFWASVAIQRERIIQYWRPRLNCRVAIAFAPVDAKFVTHRHPPLSEHASRQRAFEFCAEANIKGGILPETVDDFEKFMSEEFRSFYRKCWEASRSAKAEQPKVITLRPSK